MEPAEARKPLRQLMYDIEGVSLMEIRLAVMEDLPKIKRMYQQLVEDMQRRRLQIWDEIYPCEFLA